MTHASTAHRTVTTIVERSRSAEPGAEAGNLPQTLRRLRRERGLTLEMLASRSAVSRAMISKIERGAAVPTATILGRLSAALEVGLSRLLDDTRPREATLLPRAAQAVYRDPASGLRRRSLSPVFPDRSVDLVLNTLPAGGHVVFPGHRPGVEEYLFVRRGRLTVVVDGAPHRLEQGDTLFYPAHGVHEFHNDSAQEAEFLIVVDDTRLR